MSFQCFKEGKKEGRRKEGREGGGRKVGGKKGRKLEGRKEGRRFCLCPTNGQMELHKEMSISPSAWEVKRMLLCNKQVVLWSISWSYGL